MPNVSNAMRALNPVGPAGLTDCEIVLRALLSEGPRNSRDVLAELADRSFTAKQVRRARERQGVVIDRQGFGALAHTIWRVSLVPSAPTSALADDYVRASARQQKVPEKTIFRAAATTSGTLVECSEMLVSAAPAAAAETPMPLPLPLPSMHRDPLQRGREIRTMPVAELKHYAKQIGLRQRDIDELTEDRLRQNCMLTVAALVEAYTE